MSKMKDLLITLIEKGDHKRLAAIGADPKWIDEARVVALEKQMMKRGRNETQKKRSSTARELFRT